MTTACKECVMVRARVIARGMIALGFSIEAAKEKVQSMLTEAGFSLSIRESGYWGTELLATNKDVRPNEHQYYIVCRSGGV